MKVIFIGLSGYEYSFTRVRCYHFAEILKKYGIKTDILSFKDHLTPETTEAGMFATRIDKKLWLTTKALKKLWKEKNAIFYIQKIHYNAAHLFFSLA